MSVSRRIFMKAGVVATAFAAFPLNSALAQNRSGAGNGSLVNSPGQESPSAKISREQLNYYTQSSFTPYLHTQFHVYLNPSSSRALKLTEVSDNLAALSKSATRGNPQQMECFSLLLTIPPGRSFEQDTYLIEHDALGTFYMFLVPVGQRGKSALDYYEAVIYRHPGQPRGYDSAFSEDTSSAQAPPARTADGQVLEASTSGQNLRTEQEVFYFRPQANPSSAIPAQTEEPGAAGRRAAARLSVAQSPDIGGLRLGMTLEQVLALLPGVKEDAELRYSLNRPASRFGEQSLIVRPGKYSLENRFDRVSQIVFTFLDGRVASLNVGYDGPVWEHVDEFVAKFSAETRLPGPDSWDAYPGMDTQLKTLRGRDFEVSIYAGGQNVNINYVQLRDTAAQQRLKERRASARKLNGGKS